MTLGLIVGMKSKIDNLCGGVSLLAIPYIMKWRNATVSAKD
jgi:hypothetical protein